MLHGYHLVGLEHGTQDEHVLCLTDKLRRVRGRSFHQHLRASSSAAFLTRALPPEGGGLAPVVFLKPHCLAAPTRRALGLRARLRRHRREASSSVGCLLFWYVLLVGSVEDSHEVDAGGRTSKHEVRGAVAKRSVAGFDLRELG